MSGCRRIDASVAPFNPAPVSVTDWPPAAGPFVGEIELRTGL